MRKYLVIAVALVSLLGLAGCGDDDGADVRSSGDASASGASGSGTSGSGTSCSETTETTENNDTTVPDDGGVDVGTGVDGYCEAVEVYVDLIVAATEDPESADQAAITQVTQDLISAAIQLTDLSPEESQRLADCEQEAADAALDAVPGG